MTFFEFAERNPWLTFFLFLLVCATVEAIAIAVGGRRKCPSETKESK